MRQVIVSGLALCLVVAAGATQDPESLNGAFVLRNGALERYSLNGLWRCRPSFTNDPADFVPGETEPWSWGRIPSAWDDGRKIFPATSHVSPTLNAIPGLAERIAPDRVWYHRVLELPASAKGRRVSLAFDLVSTKVDVWINGHKAGVVAFPCGEVEVTEEIRFGEKNTIDLDVTAYAEAKGTLEFNAPDRADMKKSTVLNKGLTGDVWLDIRPKGVRVVDVWTETDAANREVTFVAEVDGELENRVAATVDISRCGASEACRLKGTARVDGGRARFTVKLPDEIDLWDVHRPTLYQVTLTVGGVRALPFRTGFREIRLKGRDIVLNGSPIHLRSSFVSSLRWGASYSCKEYNLALAKNLIAHGWNFVITANYGFKPGDVCNFDGYLEAFDETGLLSSFSLPHIVQFDRKLNDPEVAAKYRDTCRKLIRRMRNHPSVLFYAMNHNTTGYHGDQDPRQIGLAEEPQFPSTDNPRTPWDPGYNRPQAKKTHEIVRELDPTRPSYHHESGNLDDFHTLNIYLNWSPVQERSDWLEDWASRGVKPVFFVEWGLPHLASWSSCRGPAFIWSGTDFQSAWMSEYGAIFYGDRAYVPDEQAVELLRKEESLWATGKPFAYAAMCELIKRQDRLYAGVQGLYAADNLRSFRGWGASAVLPWDYDTLYRRTAAPVGMDNAKAWTGEKTPGIVADRIPEAWLDPAHWTETLAGDAVKRWFRDDCAWIAGAAGLSFTDKRHLYREGEKIAKTLMIVNDRREAQVIRWACRVKGFEETACHGKVCVKAGEKTRIPVGFAALPQGEYRLEADFVFADGVEQKDEFPFSVLPEENIVGKEVLLYDPKGLTEANLKRLGIASRAFEGNPRGSCLVVGRESLTSEWFESTVKPFAKRGGRVVVFEQGKVVLESLGFRVQEYGLRNAFLAYRTPEFAGFSDEWLRDWSGEATLLAPYLPETDGRLAQGGSTWAGMAHSRVWRCRNRGTVASVLPEKPSFGDWRAWVEGGFDSQSAPLLEWSVGEGSIVFCQLDVTARTEPDPAADRIVRRLLGDRSANARRRDAPSAPRLFRTGDRKPDGFADWIANGGTALLCGFSATEVLEWSPVELHVEEVTNRFYTRIEKLPHELNGLSNASWAWHGSMDFAAFVDSCDEGNEAFRVVHHGKGRLVFWQVPPEMIDAEKRPYLRSSRRHAEIMYSRLKANLGFREEVEEIRYADAPRATDDPFRYYRW